MNFTCFCPVYNSSVIVKVSKDEGSNRYIIGHFSAVPESENLLI